LSISLTTKCRLFARKKRLAKRNKATLISLWSQERAISPTSPGLVSPGVRADFDGQIIYIFVLVCVKLYLNFLLICLCFFASHHNTFISHYKYISEVADICKEKHPLTKIEMVHFNVSKIINRTGSIS
jgi:hypothetical protein